MSIRSTAPKTNIINTLPTFSYDNENLIYNNHPPLQAGLDGTFEWIKEFDDSSCEIIVPYETGVLFKVWQYKNREIQFKCNITSPLYDNKGIVRSYQGFVLSR